MRLENDCVCKSMGLWGEDKRGFSENKQQEKLLFSIR